MCTVRLLLSHIV